ncbi:MAG: FAD-dependent oxidoreductase [Chloroflexota bacterium]|nr:FAD-dependent oxidoreductase [Chloroflexota bacterium]
MSASIPTYDLAIIGGGTTGLTAAQAALALGAKTALIEGGRTGGECTWTGCIPSKALLAIAKQVAAARHAARYGVHYTQPQIDFAAAMEHIGQIIYDIYREESPDALRKQGLDVYEAYAQFRDAHTLALSDGRSLRAKRILIGVGAKPIIPPVFHDVPYLTNETLFDLRRLPDHLIIIGGGAQGVEMAQAFRRLGARVTLVEQAAHVLPSVDAEAVRHIRDVLLAEGIFIAEGCTVERAWQQDGHTHIRLSSGNETHGDAVLLAVGKRPHLDSLNLAAAGIETPNGRLVLDERLRTTQRHIYAAGDVTGGPQYTHYAGWQAFIAVRNALLPAPLGGKGTRETTPYSLFTDPEIAQAGMTEEAAQQQYGERVHITRLQMTRADRAMTDLRGDGFMKLIHLPDGKLLGATLVGTNASEMINDWIAVLERGGNVSSAATAMRVYPSLGTANVILATEQVKSWLVSSMTGKLLRALVKIF